MPQLLCRLLVLVPDLGCTMVCAIARVCLGTVLRPSFQPAARAPWVFLSATSVSGRPCAVISL